MIKPLLTRCSAASALAIALVASAPAAARDATYTVTLNQDNFFGFNPSFNGLVPVSDKVDFSFYGTWAPPLTQLSTAPEGCLAVCTRLVRPWRPVLAGSGRF